MDDAVGNTWILRGFQMGIKPQYTHEEFLAGRRGQFKVLPAGWKFRVETLEEDLIEIPEDGKANIMADEFFSFYVKTGSGLSNYQP